MDKTKRDFLKIAGGAMASMSMPLGLWLPASAQAQAAIVPSTRKLVVLLLQGGNDGVNTVIPLDSAEYSNYQALRPTIGIPEEFVLPYGTAANNVALGLHPSLSSLMPLQNNLAIFPATHSGAFSNRSHFFQYDFFGAGLYVGETGLNDSKGWLGRYLDNKNTIEPEGIVAFDFTSGKFRLTNSSNFILGLSNPANASLGTGAAQADAIWNDVKATLGGTTGINPIKYSQDQQRLFDEVLPRLAATVDFSRAPAVSYPGGLGTNLKRAADMLLGLPELEVVHVSVGGFDTHRNQVAAGDTTAGNHANLLQALGDSLAAFYNDLAGADASLHSNVTVVVQTEFGRTAAENANLGTDHAQASTWMAFGAPVIGGVYGDYPGLGAGDLESGRYLRETVDYRDILSEILGPKFLGESAANVNSIFPGYTGAATTPLNFIA